MRKKMAVKVSQAKKALEVLKGRKDGVKHGCWQRGREGE